MKFLLSLTLILIVAYARRGEDLFRPARSCDRTAEEVTEMEAQKAQMLEKLGDAVEKMCAGDEVDDATVKAFETEEDVTEDKEMSRRGKKGPRAVVKDFLTEAKCADEDRSDVISELAALLESQRPKPCEEQITLENVLEKQAEQCSTEEVVVDERRRMRGGRHKGGHKGGKKGGKGRGEEKPEKEPLCFEPEDWVQFMGAADAVNFHELDLGMRKLRAMNILTANFEKNCVKTEDSVEAEVEAQLPGVLRRLLMDDVVEISSSSSSSEEEEDKKSDRKSEAVAAFMENCEEVNHTTVSDLFEETAVEFEARKEEMETRKAEMEAKRAARQEEMEAKRAARRAEMDAKRAARQAEMEANNTEDAPKRRGRGGRGGKSSKRRGSW